MPEVAHLRKFSSFEFITSKRGPEEAAFVSAGLTLAADGKNITDCKTRP